VESHRRLLAEVEAIFHKYKSVQAGQQPDTRTIANPHKSNFRKLFVFNDIIVIAKEAVSGKKVRKKPDRKDRSSGLQKTPSTEDEEEGKWRFVRQVDLETCQVEGLDDVYDFISSRYTQKNAIRLSECGPGRFYRFGYFFLQNCTVEETDMLSSLLFSSPLLSSSFRLTLQSPDEKQRVLEQLRNAILSFVRADVINNPSSQRTSSYILPHVAASPPAS